MNHARSPLQDHTVLGLLFLIYVNDMPNGLKGNVKLFADIYF